MRVTELLRGLEQLLTAGGETAAVEAAYERCQQPMTEVARRLRLCEQYVSKGMRSEAINLAEMPLAVSDSLSGWTAADHVRLSGLLADKQFPPLPTISFDTREQLAAGKAAEMTLQPLLTRHRNCAIGGASIERRFAALCALRDADPDNPVWTSGLLVLEPAYLHRTRALAATAAAAGDRTALANLVRCVESEKIESIDRDALIREMDNAIAIIDARLAERELSGIATRILSSYELQDDAACLNALADWEAAAQKLQSAIPDTLQDQVLPALKWVRLRVRGHELQERNRLAKLSIVEGKSKRRWFGWKR